MESQSQASGRGVISVCGSDDSDAVWMCFGCLLAVVSPGLWMYSAVEADLFYGLLEDSGILGFIASSTAGWTRRKHGAGRKKNAVVRVWPPFN